MAIIPADRIWTPVYGTNLGVKGKLQDIGPARTLGETIDAATYGTGLVDATAHFEAKMAATDANEYCYVPAGTYLVNRLLWYPSEKTLRGAGEGLTILKATQGGDAVIQTGTSDYPRPTTSVAITGGLKGDATLTVANTATFTQYRFVRVQNTGVNYVVHASSGDPSGVANDPKRFGSLHYITAINSSTVLAIDPPLVADLFPNAEAVAYSIAPTVRFGVEDMTIDCNNIASAAVQFEGTHSCWVKNVEVKNSNGRGIYVMTSVFPEVRKVNQHSLYKRNGVSTEGIVFINDVSWGLIEDCRVRDGGLPGICLGDGTGPVSGTVIGYCFSVEAFYPGSPPPANAGISLNHGPHNSFCLAEGCITDGIMSDGFWGSASHNTIHRCWGTARHSSTINRFAFLMARWQTYFNITGNIMATPEINVATEGVRWYGYPDFGNGTTTSGGVNDPWGPQTPPTYRAQGDDVGGRDLNVEETMIEHGNFIYTGASGSQQWDSGIADHDLPASYYTTKAELVERGVVFGSLPWPTIDPANPPGNYTETTRSILPAGYRDVNDDDPPSVVYSGGKIRRLIF
jgi:hypothetical protein